MAEVRTSQTRVLRLMRKAGSLAPSRQIRVLWPRSHEGTIVTQRPDEMWGTDATSAWTTREGHVTIFVAVDRCTAEGVGIHAAKIGCSDRFIRTRKEQLLWVRTFETVEELRLALHAWRKIYNERWLIERHGHRSPAQVRRDLPASSVAA